MSKSTKKLSELSIDELSTRRRELKEESLMLRVQKEAGQLENPRASARPAAKWPASRPSSPRSARSVPEA